MQHMHGMHAGYMGQSWVAPLSCLQPRVSDYDGEVDLVRELGTSLLSVYHHFLVMSESRLARTRAGDGFGHG